MDEIAKNLLAQSSRNIAGNAFANAMEQQRIMYANLPSVPSIMQDVLLNLFSASNTIKDLGEVITKWRDDAPEHKHLVVTLRTPDGRVMDVNSLRNQGAQAFVAEGNIMGMPSMVMGHISTLSLFFSYEETKGTNPAGFKIATTKTTTESPLEPVPTEPDTPKPTP